MTTRETLDAWFEDGVRNDADFMIITTDTFSYEDYPVYVRGSKDLATQRAHELEHAPMCKVMEVYDLRGDKEAQIVAAETWAVPKPEPGPHARSIAETIHMLTKLGGCKA